MAVKTSCACSKAFDQWDDASDARRSGPDDGRRLARGLIASLYRIRVRPQYNKAKDRVAGDLMERSVSLPLPRHGSCGKARNLFLTLKFLRILPKKEL